MMWLDIFHRLNWYRLQNWDSALMPAAQQHQCHSARGSHTCGLTMKMSYCWPSRWNAKLIKRKKTLSASMQWESRCAFIQTRVQKSLLERFRLALLWFKSSGFSDLNKSLGLNVVLYPSGPAALLRRLRPRIPHVLPEASDDPASGRYVRRIAHRAARSCACSFMEAIYGEVWGRRTKGFLAALCHSVSTGSWSCHLCLDLLKDKASAYGEA